jgi:hypothetical protein
MSRLLKADQLVEPGLMYLPLWRSEREDDHLLDERDGSSAYVAVGREA